MMSTKERERIYVINLVNSSKDDAGKLIDYIKEGHSVVVNFSECETATAQTFFYNLLGAIYALNGNYIKIGNETWVFSTKKINKVKEE